MCIHYNMLISKPHRVDLRYIHACMGFKHHDLLFKYLNSTLHWLWPHLVFFTPTQSSSLYNCTTNFLSCMHAHTLPVGIIHRTHAIFFFRLVSHEGTHPHTSPSPSYWAFFISHVHAQWSMFLYVCVCVARSFTVFHINRSIYISSEVSPSFPRPHRSIYTSLYRITGLFGLRLSLPKFATPKVRQIWPT